MASNSQNLHSPKKYYEMDEERVAKIQKEYKSVLDKIADDE